MPEVRMAGLRPEPLAQYLSALAVLRLVGEQEDANASGRWVGDQFALSSKLDEDQLVEFFCTRYRPSPVVGPWNGGSGFWPKDNTEGLQAILDSRDPRFAVYCKVIEEVRGVIGALDLRAKPDKKVKGDFIGRLRAELSDEALNWIDAALVLTNDGERFPPLLGTGGNDGRLEFSNNFMKRVADLLLGSSDPNLVRGHLFGDPTTGMLSAPVGQFSPAQAGGANSSTGFGGSPQVNPWAYVLMLEGALVPSGAATRRLESLRRGAMAFPFAVRSSMVGYASASPEESRDELWLPIWDQPATLQEIRHLFAEGRAKVPTRRGGKIERREAVDGLDFARAIASLGVDRGIRRFSRYAFQQRNGLAFFAVPLGRWVVRNSKGADLLAEIDPWLGRLRGFVGSGKAPGSVASSTRRLEAAIMEACKRDEWTTILEILVALAEVEAALGRAKDRKLEPLPSLSPAWFQQTREDSPEYRLATSLASAGIRPRLRPVVPARGRRWSWQPSSSKTTTWMDTASLEENLLQLLRRHEIEDQQKRERKPFQDAFALGITIASKNGRIGQPRCWASLPDIAAFIDGVDDRRLESLIGGLSLIDWSAVPAMKPDDDHAVPPAAFALLALAHGLEDPNRPEHLLPMTTGMLANAAAGRLDAATRLAIQRLRAIGWVFPAEQLADERRRARRIAAALVFPLAPQTQRRLARMLFPRFSTKDQNVPEQNPEELHP